MLHEQYDYANDLVKIFGFKNLADFTAEISYAELKKHEEYICTAINETLSLFKSLFKMKKFNLTRLNYELKTIDQAMSFFKKILDSLFIAYDTPRISGTYFVRLIRENKIYAEYINKMSNIDQKVKCENAIENAPFKTEEIKSYTLTELTEKYGSPILSTEYIHVRHAHMTVFDLCAVADIYDCITEITINSTTYEGTLYFYYSKLHTRSYMHVNETITINDPFILNRNIKTYITFPGYFNDHHCPIINVTLSGFKFKNMPASLLSKHQIYIDTMKLDSSAAKYYYNTEAARNPYEKIHDEYQYVLTNNTLVLKKMTDFKIEYFDIELFPIMNVGINKYIIENNVSERCENDVWITSFNNDGVDYIPIAKEFKWYLPVIRKYKKYGYSILTKDIIERPYFGIEFNCYVKVDANYVVSRGDQLMLNYTVAEISAKSFKIYDKLDDRVQHMTNGNECKCGNKHNSTGNYDITVIANDNTYICSKADLSATSFAVTPNMPIILSIIIPKEYLLCFSKLTISYKKILYDEIM